MNKDDQQFYDRLPPHDVTAELCYLGALILCDDRTEKGKIVRACEPKSFYLADNEMFYASVARMIEEGKHVDAVTVFAELSAKGVDESINARKMLTDMMEAVPVWQHWPSYASIINNTADRRTALNLGMKLAARMNQPADDDLVKQIVSETVQGLWGLSRERNRIDVFTLGRITEQFIWDKTENKTPPLLTGISALDEYPGIFGFGKYTVIAGRPSMGKSTMVRWLLECWAKAGTAVGLIAVEEDRTKIAGNYISSNSNIENHIIAYSDLDSRQLAEAGKAVNKLANLPWYGVDTAYKLGDVATAFEMLVTEHKCKIIAVDHLHLISHGSGENDQWRVKEISQKLKELAKRFHVCLVAAAQLSRPTEKIKVPPLPTMTDLRASGAIEEHADAALFLHREDYYRRDEEPDHLCQIIVAKNRNARTGKIVLKAVLENQRFEESDPVLGYQQSHF